MVEEEDRDMSEQPDPMPNPVHYSNGREACNAEYVVHGVIVGYCDRIIRKGRRHRGKHRISWPHEELTDE